MYRSSPSIGALIDLLETQQARFEAVLTVLDRERAAFKVLAAPPLVRISESKLGLLEEIRLLEERRSAVVFRLASKWGVQADGLTLRAIAERLGPIERGLLLRLHERLNRVVTAVGDATSLNGELIAHSLSFLSPGFEAGERRESGDPTGRGCRTERITA